MIGEPPSVEHSQPPRDDLFEWMEAIALINHLLHISLARGEGERVTLHSSDIHRLPHALLKVILIFRRTSMHGLIKGTEYDYIGSQRGKKESPTRWEKQCRKRVPPTRNETGEMYTFSKQLSNFLPISGM